MPGRFRQGDRKQGPQAPGPTERMLAPGSLGRAPHVLPAEIIFLTVEQVNTLHEEAVRRYSSTESLAIRDAGLLESAVMAPQHTWGGAYLYRSLIEMAVVYLISLDQNHAYENGNKRVAFAACSTFLRMNGFRLMLSQDEAFHLTLGIAGHRIDRAEVVGMLESHIEPI